MLATHFPHYQQWLRWPQRGDYNERYNHGRRNEDYAKGGIC